MKRAIARSLLKEKYDDLKLTWKQVFVRKGVSKESPMRYNDIRKKSMMDRIQ